VTLAELNALDRGRFVAALAAIFEHSPWVADAVADSRPFASVDALHAAMAAAVERAGADAQLTLIRAHPQLAGRAAIAGELTADSRKEQAGAGLDRCTPAEYARLCELNAAYDARFGFPFILAVRGHTRASIIDNMAQRLPRDREAELAEALAQIARIARFRLNDLLEP
jgi:OHCU decarboxylase